jgi:SsrA-binding protein
VIGYGVIVSRESKKIITSNRRARHNFAIEKTVEAGLELLGSEVKSLRSGTASIAEAFVSFENRQAFLVGAHIPIYPQAGNDNHTPLRKRKLLMNRKQIADWGHASDAQGHSVIPLALYFIGPWIKIELGLGKGRKKYDKREKLKEQDQKREMRRAYRR